MKKVFIALTSVLMLASCAGSSDKKSNDNLNSDSNYVAYVDFTEEEKTLFESEIGINDELYLADMTKFYKVNRGIPITVTKLSDDTSLDDIYAYDLKIAKANLISLHGNLPGITDETVNGINNAPCGIVEQFSCVGLYYDFGAKYSITYMLFNDEVSYTSAPLGVDVVTAWTSERKTEAEYANHSELDLRVLLHVLQFVRGEYPIVYSGITKTLSTGQKVRINFAAELK